MCRILKLWSSDSSLMVSAGDSLENLECKLATENDQQFRSALKKVGTFTALTRLELPDFRSAGAEFAAVRRLPLQELVLLYCQNLEVELILPGALLSLRKLHIEDYDTRKQEISEHPGMMERLGVCSRTLLSLPHLYQLSGSGVLFCAAMKDVLQTWHVAEYQEGSINVDLMNRGSAIEARLRVWIKP